MRAHRLVVSFLALVMSVGMLAAQAPDTSALVRLSYVQGEVKVLEGDRTQFEQARANMPLLAGFTLVTGQDGQAEMEFTDGSVARVTPASQLRLDKLPSADERTEPTEMTLLSGLGYFELNTGSGQHFTVRFNAAEARPVTNSIFRINLDNAPDISVFTGTVRAAVSGGFDQTVEEGGSLRFDANDASNVTTASIQSDTWDQWNEERDNHIAQQAQQQTSARENSGATNQPGWDDLDANGDWYPVEGYGNVWMPNNEPAGWDPYGNGYWANYPGWGYTWISSYPWGWLPYHCGAWNYWNSLGWGWIPGQCGLGWQPTVIILNAPHGYHHPVPPPRPIPGGHAGAPSREQLVAVTRGPVLPTGGGIHNHHTQPIRVEGQRIDPLPVLESRGGLVSGTHTMPVGRSYGFTGNDDNNVRPVPVTPRPVFRPTTPIQSPIRPVPGPVQGVRPVIPEPQRITPAPPRMYTAPPPRAYSPPPAPAPHMSAPPVAAPHPGGGPPGHH
jgi:uncharacterized protein DUF6600/FecR-like protein